MIEFKLIYSTGDETIQVPQTWHELSFDKYVELVNLDQLNDHGETDWLMRASIVSGISIENLKQCSQLIIVTLINCLAFISNGEPIVEASKNVQPEFKNFDIMATEYGQWEAMKQVLKEVDKAEMNRINAGARIAEIYTRKRISKSKVERGIEINNKPVTEVLGLVNFFLSKLESS